MSKFLIATSHDITKHHTASRGPVTLPPHLWDVSFTPQCCLAAPSTAVPSPRDVAVEFGRVFSGHVGRVSGLTDFRPNFAGLNVCQLAKNKAQSPPLVEQQQRQEQRPSSSRVTSLNVDDVIARERLENTARLRLLPGDAAEPRRALAWAAHRPGR